MMRSTRAVRLAAAFAAQRSSLTTAVTTSEPESSGDNGSSEHRRPQPKGDGTLTVGTLLPQTGDLAFLGPPEFAGVDLAIEDINAAGGVLGKDVVERQGRLR